MIQDALKPLSEVLKSDPRHVIDGSSLESRHAQLAEIQLLSSVPADVRQLFETAKNLSLYAWFVYRFHPVSGLVARAAFEMALRARWVQQYGTEPSSKDRGLSKLMRHAIKEKWLRPGSFRSMESLAAARVSEKKLHEILTAGDTGEAFSVVSPTQAEIDRELEELDVPSRLARSTPQIRNALAHGSSMLDGKSVGVLRRMAEAINALYA
jgi:hypothetical protein